MELILEINQQQTPDKTQSDVPGMMVSHTPTPKNDYWLFKIQLSPEQALVAFPKFGTIGIGFLNEKTSANTNLPFTCDTNMIYNHIAKNKGSPNILPMTCIQAIQMLQHQCTKQMNTVKQ